MFIEKRCKKCNDKMNVFIDTKDDVLVCWYCYIKEKDLLKENKND